MIKFIASNSGRELIGIGLSDANIKKLKEHKPIKIMGEDLGLDFKDVLIFWGKTEEVMEKTLIKQGLITDKTKINRGHID